MIWVFSVTVKHMYVHFVTCVLFMHRNISVISKIFGSIFCRLHNILESVSISSSLKTEETSGILPFPCFSIL